MKKFHQILEDITRVTSVIETKYPELYQFLDENPITIPSFVHPNLDITILEDYFDDLNELLKHHLETRKTKMV
ncbi:hypothetical protein [Cellulophaga sp. Hel_I_12]|uniref:hypothetical protein n=1 Tax=Cellulophaga sp. Hel_I_12 TaxID=1249972 RepID=UPI000645676D|nr:hypothetical protein [Cellulophaga sp. Hel_I_12]